MSPRRSNNMDALPTRDLLIQVAGRLFREKGYSNVSLQDTAELVRIRKPSIYHHFKSKQALLQAVLADCSRPFNQLAEEIIASRIPATEKLRRLVRSHVLLMIKNFDAIAIFLQQPNAIAEEQKQDFIRQRDYYGSILREIIHEGQRSGEFVPVDPHLAKLGLLGMCNWITHWYKPDGPASPEQIADTFADLAVRALRSEPTASLSLQEYDEGAQRATEVEREIARAR